MRDLSRLRQRMQSVPQSEIDYQRSRIKEVGYIPLNPDATPREIRSTVKQVRQALVEGPDPRNSPCWCGRWDGEGHVCGFRDNDKPGIEQQRYLQDLEQQAQEINRLFPELRTQAELQRLQAQQQPQVVVVDANGAAALHALSQALQNPEGSDDDSEY